MVYHKKQAVFFHIPKTGGSSVEDALLILDNLNSENMQVKEYCGRKHLINYQHSFPQELLSTWRYFKFCFVRNPWDRFVSYYFHMKNLKLLKESICFNDFVKKFYYGGLQEIIKNKDIDDCHLFMQPCYSWSYCADYTGRFEHLQQDFNEICSILKIESIDLKVINKNQKEHYSYYYDKKSIRLIEDYYKIDIDNYGYKYENMF